MNEYKYLDAEISTIEFCGECEKEYDSSKIEMCPTCAGFCEASIESGVFEGVCDCVECEGGENETN